MTSDALVLPRADARVRAEQSTGRSTCHSMSERLPGESAVVDRLGLEHSDDRLVQGIVEFIPNGADRADDAGVGGLEVKATEAYCPCSRVDTTPAWWTKPRCSSRASAGVGLMTSVGAWRSRPIWHRRGGGRRGLSERAEEEPGLPRGTDPPDEHPTGPHVDDERGVDEPAQVHT